MADLAGVWQWKQNLSIPFLVLLLLKKYDQSYLLQEMRSSRDNSKCKERNLCVCVCVCVHSVSNLDMFTGLSTQRAFCHASISSCKLLCVPVILWFKR